MTAGRWHRGAACALAALAAIDLAGCASRERLSAVPTVASPKYPDFVFPSMPANAPAVVTSRHERGWQFLQAGDLRTAEQEFGAALRRQPTFYPSIAGLGYVELAGDRAQPALGTFEKALKTSSDYVPALVGRGQALLALGRPAEALDSFEAALAKSGDATALADVRRRVEVLRFQNTQSLVTSARQAAAAGRHDQARQIYKIAIEASPESAFLYRELGLEDRADDDLDQALEHLRRASELDPSDARSLVQMGEIYELKDDLDAAAAAYTKAMAIESSTDVGRRLEGLREKAALAGLPAEYRAIESAPQLTRGALAALVGVNLADIVQSARRPGSVVATDTRNHWAATWILPVVSAGVMEVYPNHTFQPGAVVRRGEMAQAVSRLLNLVALRRPRLSADWRKARPRIADVNPGNLVYPAAALAVSSGVMPLLDGETFQPTRPVTGAEAVAAMQRLRQLAR
ncbi:MAG: S-layer homology domain-containing protein [Acidobacteria bacterium]|nr:S-layer homology domain-containing protein [Acidobacteriota bacterium]